MDQDAKKLIVAKAALEYIQNGTILGVGTGSTVNHLIDLLPSVKDKIETVVSSSEASTALLKERGFEVTRLNAVNTSTCISTAPTRPPNTDTSSKAAAAH